MSRHAPPRGSASSSSRQHASDYGGRCDPSSEFHCDGDIPGCGVVNASNIYHKWPTIKYIPWPEPPTGTKDHDRWQRERKYWKKLKCGQGRGYFCREHGVWITCSEISQNKALETSCPSSHYDALSPFAEPYDEATYDISRADQPHSMAADDEPDVQGILESLGQVHLGFPGGEDEGGSNYQWYSQTQSGGLWATEAPPHHTDAVSSGFGEAHPPTEQWAASDGDSGGVWATEALPHPTSIGSSGYGESCEGSTYKSTKGKGIMNPTSSRSRASHPARPPEPGGTQRPPHDTYHEHWEEETLHISSQQDVDPSDQPFEYGQHHTGTWEQGQYHAGTWDDGQPHAGTWDDGQPHAGTWDDGQPHTGNWEEGQPEFLEHPQDDLPVPGKKRDAKRPRESRKGTEKKRR